MLVLLVVLILGYTVFPWFAGKAPIEVPPEKLPVTFGLCLFTLALVGCHLITGVVSQKFSRGGSGLTFLLTILVILGPLLDLLLTAYQKSKNLPSGATELPSGAAEHFLEVFLEMYVRSLEFGAWVCLAVALAAWLLPHTDDSSG
jgi:hypothetical protein